MAYKLFGVLGLGLAVGGLVGYTLGFLRGRYRLKKMLQRAGSRFADEV